MPRGFDLPHPGGMAANSPTFPRWVREFRGAQVPPGLIGLRRRVPNVETLGFCRMSLWAHDLARSCGASLGAIPSGIELHAPPHRSQETSNLEQPINGHTRSSLVPLLRLADRSWRRPRRSCAIPCARKRAASWTVWPPPQGCSKVGPGHSKPEIRIDSHPGKAAANRIRPFSEF